MCIALMLIPGLQMPNQYGEPRGIQNMGGGSRLLFIGLFLLILVNVLFTARFLF